MGVGRKIAGFKPIKAKITKAISVGTYLNVADNSGAKKVQVIAVRSYHGRNNRLAKAGVGDIVFAVVKEGNLKLKSKVVPCIIIRQRKEYRRKNGMHIKFEDNACILLRDVKKIDPAGTLVKGPVAAEVVQRFMHLSKIAKLVV